MPKTNFLKYFQENFRLSLENLIKNEWGYTGFQVTSENRNLSGQFNGIIDISIIHEDNSNCIVAIEIEHLSSFEQAKQNISKMKVWTHNSPNRKCSLLHVFHEQCYIHPNRIGELVRYAKDYEKRDLGFYYDFIFYSIPDARQTTAIPNNIVFSMDFKTRIWMLMENADIIPCDQVG